MLKFALVTLLLLAPATVARASDQRLPLVRFQGCYDGDTCTTTDAEKVRLACINAPDIAKRLRFRATRMSSVSYDNSAFERSSDNLRALVSGRLVGIRRITTDRYGRTVAKLFIADKNVGQRQVRNGFAVIVREDAWQCAWSLRS